jgi:uncharacterized protein YhfF
MALSHSATLSVPGPSWQVERLRERLRAQGYEGDLPTVAWFGDNQAQADELAELVRRERKRATAGLLWRWEVQGGPPRPGDRQVIVDWCGEPQAVIEITDVEIVPFEEVDAGFARDEGEGDHSLDHWRRVHWDFFVRECGRLDRTPDVAMPVVCMRFRLVHLPPSLVPFTRYDRR